MTLKHHFRRFWRGWWPRKLVRLEQLHTSRRTRLLFASVIAAATLTTLVTTSVFVFSRPSPPLPPLEPGLVTGVPSFEATVSGRMSDGCVYRHQLSYRDARAWRLDVLDASEACSWPVLGGTGSFQVWDGRQMAFYVAEPNVFMTTDAASSETILPFEVMSTADARAGGARYHSPWFALDYSYLQAYCKVSGDTIAGRPAERFACPEEEALSHPLERQFWLDAEAHYLLKQMTDVHDFEVTSIEYAPVLPSELFLVDTPQGARLVRSVAPAATVHMEDAVVEQLTVGNTGVWVATVSTECPHKHALWEIEPKTNQVLAGAISLDESCIEIIGAPDSVWLLSPGLLRQVAARTHAITATIPFHIPDFHVLASDARRLWIMGREEGALQPVLWRVAPNHDPIITEIALGESCGECWGWDLTVGPEAVWIAAGDLDTGEGRLWRIDPNSGAVTRLAHLEHLVNGFSRLAATEDTLWVGWGGELGVRYLERVGDTQTVLRIDSDTNQLVAKIPLGMTSEELTAYAGRIGVRGSGPAGHMVWQIDPQTNQPVGEPVALSPGYGGCHECNNAAIGAGALWVVRDDAGSVGRFDLTPEPQASPLLPLVYLGVVAAGAFVSMLVWRKR